MPNATYKSTYRSLVIKAIIVGAFFSATLSTAKAAPAKATKQPAVSPPTEIVIDAVVASVDGKPITLQELNQRLVPKRDLTFGEASRDSEAQVALDGMIRDRLIESEAAALKINISADEVNKYLDEVAKANNLSQEQFLQALREEGRSIDDYRNFVRIELMKSRILNTQVRNSVVVTDEEIDAFIAGNPSLDRDGFRVKLSRIVVVKEIRTPEEVAEILQKIETELDDGANFVDLVEKYSDASQTEPGGSLGLVAEKDLSPAIFDAILDLKDGEHSKPVDMPNSYQIFFVEERITADTNRKRLRAEVREMLLKQKLEAAAHNYFEDVLVKRFPVDRKI